jgi:hypothetical protein
MNIERMMHVANRAKTIGEEDYTLNNMIFALLLREYFIWRSGKVTKDGVYRVSAGQTFLLELNLETKDPRGTYNTEVDYDLLVLIAKNGRGKVLNSICIPIQHLYSYSAITAMKSTIIVKRGVRRRDDKEAGKNEAVRLWKKLFCAVPREELREAALSNLSSEQCRNIDDILSEKIRLAAHS